MERGARGGSDPGSGPEPGRGPAASFRVVDVGTGAGLPGMVLAAARPQWKVTLLDSLRKRCDFLRQAAAVAGLTNVEVVWCRAEEGGQRPDLRQAYDLAVARAVAESRVLAELCLPFVRVGGTWVASKGPNPEVKLGE
ncbi:Ribosomal RNA small subunit methyltransferase G [Tetrabaena socialis]|uniref:Ribosomal RNA small subunit methyltransferase G n=1 Tax=Tetrabaena socialis TaxID=47790 RepID=A0A2J7ZK08_9CHLO|nr:Ribosomal RNA small subunit methyltransferase G [Tetrabaena socialis]|eukprot:PNH00601.1 Ribosomal RNA small subunit methyltransferase G [Tetrabaena socialis]